MGPVTTTGGRGPTVGTVRKVPRGWSPLTGRGGSFVRGGARISDVGSKVGAIGRNGGGLTGGFRRGPTGRRRKGMYCATFETTDKMLCFFHNA